MATTTEKIDLVMGRWRSALASGLRAALACTIVGLVSLYAPPVIRRHITFPAFSYVVTVIIVSDATLGTALMGAVSAVHATLMGAAPSVLALWLAHRTGAAESVVATSAVVALTTFAVALPTGTGSSSSSVVAKRIALGQIIIIYVARFKQGERPALGFALMHPANVVACTALGVAAALLAVLLPWPRLATTEASKKARAYKVLAVQRVRVMSDAFLRYYCVNAPAPEEEKRASCRRRRRWCIASCMSEARRLASASTKLLHSINSVTIREDVRWERLCKWAQAADHHKEYTEMETPLTGMQMALAMMGNAGTDKQQDSTVVVGDLVMTIKDQTRLALLDQGSTKQDIGSKANKALLAILSNSNSNSKQELAPLLFLFSLYQLHRGTSDLFTISSNNSSNAKKLQVAPADEAEQDKDQPPATKAITVTTWWTKQQQHNILVASKCGFSLGLAVLLGLLFSNDHGFWSGLIVATTMAAGRDSTWALGIARAHGTALGSVYGVLGCLLISQTSMIDMDLRFLALLPWMVLSTFLKRSRAYGPAGGVAAALSAIIIMGRRYDEPPLAFTISRLVETFIGISCVILADLVFQPGGRPSLQAREQLTRCIKHYCFAAVTAPGGGGRSHNQSFATALALLRKYMAEARGEPTFLWLPPFPASAYDQIEGSLSRMAQLLQLCLQTRAAAAYSLLLDDDDDFSFYSRVVSTSLNHCLQLLKSPSSSVPEHETSTLQLQSHDDDLEAGRHPGPKCCSCYGEDEEEKAMTPEEVVGSFLAHATEALLLLLKKDNGEANDEGLGVCCLAVASMALCMGEIMNEALRLEAHILDLTTSLQHR